MALDCECSLEYRTNGRSPEVSSTAFSVEPPAVQAVSSVDMDFAVFCPLVRRDMPPIRFLYASFRPPRSDAVALRYYLTSMRLSRDFHPKLSNMLGTQNRGPNNRARGRVSLCASVYPIGIVPISERTSFDVGVASQEQPRGPPVFLKLAGQV
jgi:hypothetical protein